MSRRTSSCPTCPSTATGRYRTPVHRRRRQRRQPGRDRQGLHLRPRARLPRRRLLLPSAPAEHSPIRRPPLIARSPSSAPPTGAQPRTTRRSPHADASAAHPPRRSSAKRGPSWPRWDRPRRSRSARSTRPASRASRGRREGRRRAASGEVMRRDPIRSRGLGRDRDQARRVSRAGRRGVAS